MPRHHTTSLSTPDGRAVLLREVWGPPGLRRQARQMAVAGGGGGAAGSVLEGTCGVLECEGSLGALSALEGIVVIAILAATGVLIYLLVAWIVRRSRQRRHALKPNGALLCPLPPPGTHHRGTVVAGGPQIQAPSGQAAAAWSLRLHCKRFLRSDVMLRDGRCAGFTLRLEDGREARVPPGRVRFDGPPRSERPVSSSHVEAHLDQLDPLRRTPEGAQDLDPIPFDRADELVLRPGDTVELRGTLEPVVLQGQGSEGYRAASSSVLVPMGPFALRLGH